MEGNQPAREKLIAENRDLRRRLKEAEKTLEAIRQGAGRKGEERRAIEPLYRRIFDAMSEGALIFGFKKPSSVFGESFKNGLILYCNGSFAKLARKPTPKVIGSSIFDVTNKKSVEVLAWLKC